MIEHKNIHEAIVGVMENVGYVQKRKSEGLRYTYAGEADLIEAVRPHMVEHGIYMTVKRVKKLYRSSYETKSGTLMSNTLIEGIARFTHVSGTHIDVETTGEGADSGDKSSNKAMTGLYKYAIRQTFCIETGDDPDQFASESMERALKPTTTKATTSPNDTQKPLEAISGENSVSTPSKTLEAVQTAKDLAEGYTGNQILGRKNGELVKDLVALTGKTTQEVCLFVSKLEKGKKFSLGQIAEAMKEGQNAQ